MFRSLLTVCTLKSEYERQESLESYPELCYVDVYVAIGLDQK